MINRIHNTGDSEWELVPEDQRLYHDNGVGEIELKYVHPDGREVIFDGDTYELITDPEYVGTYNDFPVKQLPDDPSVLDHLTYRGSQIAHGIVDVLPYKIFGNVRK